MVAYVIVGLLFLLEQRILLLEGMQVWPLERTQMTTEAHAFVLALLPIKSSAGLRLHHARAVEL